MAADLRIDTPAATDYTISMTTEQYRRWLREQLPGCETTTDDEEAEVFNYLTHSEDCARVIRQAGRFALQLGLPNIYRLCRRRPGPLCGETTKEILAECLEALPREPRETITIDELQTVTGWSRTTIYRRRQEGTLPEPRTEGGKLFWLRSDLSGIL